MKISQLFNDFIEFEENNGVYLKKIQGEYFWEILRFGIFNDLIKGKGIFEEPVNDRPVLKLIDRAKRKLLNTYYSISKNPFIFRSKDYYFFGPGPSRKKIGADGNFWDIYCDPLIDYLGPKSCLLIEKFEFESKTYPSHTSDIGYTNYFDVIKKIPKIKKINFVEFNLIEVNYIDSLEKDFKKRFDVEINFKQLIKISIVDFKIKLLLYKMLLKRMRPKAVFLVCSYGNESLIDACRQLSIPSIEIQHGVIGPFHVGYSFPASTKKRLFPDYFLSFGKYWEDITPFPIDKGRIFTIGFPHREHLLKFIDKFEKKPQVVFISQWTIGVELSRFAVEFSRLFGTFYKIFYKLHPRESVGWKEKYPWLAESAIDVVVDEKPSLYEILAESTMQIGVYSTAIYEGIVLGCQTVLVNLPGIEHMSPLFKKNIVQVVDLPSEVVFKGKQLNKNDKNCFFENEWEKKIDEFIEKILNK